jgi:hypothetical protein
MLEYCMVLLMDVLTLFLRWCSYFEKTLRYIGFNSCFTAPFTIIFFSNSLVVM